MQEGLKRNFVEDVMAKLRESQKFPRGYDGPKERVLRNHSEPMDSTMLMDGDATKKKTNGQGKEFVMPKIPKKVSRIHVDLLFSSF